MRSESLLDIILAPGGLSVVFQPIFDVGEEAPRLHSLECLTRGPQGTNLESASVLFEYVRRKREEPLVDRACLLNALQSAGQLPGSPRLSLNVHASTLGRDRGFVGFLTDTAQRFSIPTSQLVIEIVEHSGLWSAPRFQDSLDGLRTQGMQIALDDIGLGQSNFWMILECRPDYLKIDRYFVQGAHSDYYRQAVIEAVRRLAEKFGARVVAEGVEDAFDLDCITALGITLVQGYLFSPPVPGPDLAELLDQEGRRSTAG